jgi:hypothetical protein
MSKATIYPETRFNDDSEIWENLKEAIANTSGFECWQQTNANENETVNLDQLVSCYLRETLATLAY